MADSTPHKDRDKQTEPARLADKSEHERFWRWIKAASDWTKARSKKFADESEWALGRRATRILAILGAGALYLLFGLLLWALLDWYIDPQKSSQKKDLVQALALILAGVAGAIGIYFTWRGQRLTRESQENTQKNTQQQLWLTREGQITERFTRAIELLGASNDGGRRNLEQRLGAIYALERIDKESAERAYHSTVMEVLTAYLRENARWSPKASEISDEGFIKPPGVDTVSDDKSDEIAEQDKGSERDAKLAPRLPSTDIQAILDVISRREEEGVPQEHRIKSLDLRGTDLRRAFLPHVHLEGAYLVGAHLEGALLLDAHLERAWLSAAHLEGADLRWAHLEGTIGLTPEQIEWTIGNEMTILPDGLVRPPTWSKSYPEQSSLIRKGLEQESNSGIRKG